jgi:hypothetical protein
LSIGGPCHKYTKRSAGKNIEGMVTSVHNARTSDESSAERRNHDDESPPNFTLRVQNVQLCGKVEGEVEQPSERDTAVSRGKALEAILKDVVVCLRADIDGDERQAF